MSALVAIAFGYLRLANRLTSIGPVPVTVATGMGVEFTLVSRLTLSGPANVVVTYALELGGEQHRKVVLVPAS